MRVCTNSIGSPDAAKRYRIGGAKEDRTPDLLRARQALSQLSYGPGFTGLVLARLRYARLSSLRTPCLTIKIRRKNPRLLLPFRTYFCANQGKPCVVCR